MPPPVRNQFKTLYDIMAFDGFEPHALEKFTGKAGLMGYVRIQLRAMQEVFEREIAIMKASGLPHSDTLTFSNMNIDDFCVGTSGWGVTIEKSKKTVTARMFWVKAIARDLLEEIWRIREMGRERDEKLKEEAEMAEMEKVQQEYKDPDETESDPEKENDDEQQQEEELEKN